jgi:hypothetical protein
MANRERKSDDRHRLCAVTRIRRPPDELIRFVRAPDQTVVPDLKGRLDGRGVWVTCSRHALASAVKKNTFSAGFRSPVKTDLDLPDRVDELLTRAALQALGLAKKAGQVLSGYQKVDIGLETQLIIGLFHGSEASGDGVEKLNRKYSAVSGGGQSVFECFTVEQLSLALGLGNVVHAALIDGGASLSALRAAERLAHYRTGCLSDVAA